MEPLRVEAKRIVTGRHWNRTNWPNTWTDDVALIELTKAIEFNDYAQPICLPKSFRERPGGSAYFVGCGRTNRVAEPLNDTVYYDRWVDVAHENIVTLRKWSDCRYASWFHPENYICAGQHMRLTQRGDSGGPLMVNKRGTWFQVGIFSTFKNFKGMGTAGFERVTNRCKWIKKETNGTVQCMGT
ncbi:Peptidase S1/S6 [Aphelenchoides avenae]|nr:Peptidase S1/S6 [Aphelenchus avenae]KAH7711668.1 Peptidase S1/S6 [Aphelenchus avenae]